MDHLFDVVMAVLPLMLFSYFLGTFRAERRLGQPNPRGEFLTAALTAVWLVHALVKLLPIGEPGSPLQVLVPLLGAAVGFTWLVLTRRARKGARPDGPLPK